MVVIESTGRKLKDAIDNGLAQLNKTLMDVDVEVLDNGGLFRKAKVRITVKGEDEKAEPISAPEAAPVIGPKDEQKKDPAKETLKPEVKEQKKEVKEGVKEPEKEIKDTSKEPKKEVKDTSKESKKEVKDTSKEPKKEVKDTSKETKKEVKEPKKAPKEEPKLKKESDKEQPVKSEEESKELRRNVPITQEAADRAEQIAKEIVGRMGIESTVTSSIVAGGVVIDLETQTSELIGYHGEVLDAIEYIISCAINKDDDKYYRVVVDCDNYRAKRKESLVALANKMAAKCIKIRHKVVLEPMNSNERRIIHSTLANNDKIITKSEGHEPNRRVVIFCKKK